MSVKGYAIVLAEKKSQMVPNIDMDKRDALCAVVLWLFLVFVVLAVVLFWEQNQGVENNVQKNYDISSGRYHKETTWKIGKIDKGIFGV